MADLGTTSALDWGLALPVRSVPRRINRHFRVRGRQVIGELDGPGCIRRIWVTGGGIGRELVLRIYFDGEAVPYVEAPLADFFGVMHNLSESSLRDPERQSYTMNTPFFAAKPHNGFTCYMPMPFSRSARLEVENDSDAESTLFYIVDWHEYPDEPMVETMRFAARWRREAPVRDYQDDFLILDADGPGRLVGFVHSIDMLHDRHGMRWSHAGSDNIYVDGNGLEPAFLRGIGGEDTFGTSYGGHEYFPQSALFSDMPYYVQKNPDNDDWQKLVGYRFFLNEAIGFGDSIHLRFGARAHDIATTVYWYTASPVRPYVRMPSYPDRLPGSRPHRTYDASMVNTGQWSIAGPFPAEHLDDSAAVDARKRSYDLHGRVWRHYPALRGFVDFNHRFRPTPSNANSATLDGSMAVAKCVLVSARSTNAALAFGWDDCLAYSLNGGTPVKLGDNPYFQSKSVSVHLHEGDNDLVVWLSNTVGLTQGAWAFSFRAETGGGEVLLPQGFLKRPSVDGDAVFKLSFGAGLAEPGANYPVFTPPYSEDPTGAVVGDSLDIAFSPQTEVFNSIVGLVGVTLEVSDNTSLGFRKREPVVEGPFHQQSAFLRSEVRANEKRGEAVGLRLTLNGLVTGRYELVTYHHCHSEEDSLEKASVSVDSRDEVTEFDQTWGTNPNRVTVVTTPFEVQEGQASSFYFESESAIVINGFHLRIR